MAATSWKCRNSGNVPHFYNCGIGMVLVVNAEDADAIQKFLQQQGETVYQIGRIRSRQGEEHQTQVN